MTDLLESFRRVLVQILYTPGLFLNAELDKASEDNERNALVIETGGTRIGVVQIAGLVARRIVSFARPGDVVGVGERFGLIRFGSCKICPNVAVHERPFSPLRAG